MKPHSNPNPGLLRDKAFLLLVIAVSVAFAWILRPFYSAVLWAVVLAVLFSPLHRWMAKRMRGRQTPAALFTVFIILVMVILPLTGIAGLLLREGLNVYERIQSGEMDFSRFFQQAVGSLPAWVTPLLDRFGLTDLPALQEKVSNGLMQGIRFFAGHAFDVGQNTFDFIIRFFIMLYLLFFFLRDGRELMSRIADTVPLDKAIQRKLSRKFTNVIRATTKGTVVVALLQGFLGGIIFWFLGIHAPVLWGAVMAVFALLPAIGSAIIWLPVALYLLVTAAVWQGVVLILYGVLVIGLVDNLVRPVLVGKDTQMPDYVILISTLGGIAVFGLNGLVIGPVIAAIFMAVWDTVAAFGVDNAE